MTKVRDISIKHNVMMPLRNIPSKKRMEHIKICHEKLEKNEYAHSIFHSNFNKLHFFALN